jgi:hypothetical protein
MTEFSKIGLEEWELELINKYPLVFTEPDLEAASHYRIDGEHAVGKIDKNYCNLRYGFEHGPGWKNLIEEYATTASALITEIRKFYSPDPKVFYIHSFIWKEKFGVLTIQGNISLPDPYATVWRAFESKIENSSKYICEKTGKPGRLMQRGGWIKVLCAEEAQKTGYEPSSLR